MTWAILVRSNDPMRLEFLGTLGVRILFYILPSLGFLAFDSATPSLAINMKEHEDIALPMSEENGGRKGRWWKVALVSIGNVLLGVAIQMGIELFFTQVLHLRSLLKISTTVPLPWSIAKDLMLGLVLREALTYVLHRFALHSEHSPRLVKMHNSWQHSLPSPFSLVAHYDHPLAYLIHVFIPTYIPAIVLRMHLLTYHIYLVLVSVEETFAYSGYNVLPSAFKLGGMARRQEKHLMGNGAGNFGCFGLADFVMGTGLSTDQVDDVIDEAGEKQVAKKAKGKAKAVGKKARGKKKMIEPAEEEDEEETPEKEEEERPRRKARKNSRKSSDEEPRRKPSTSGRNGRYRSEGEDAVGGQLEDEEEEEQPKPKRKPPKLASKGSPIKKAGGRPRKRSGDEE